MPGSGLATSCFFWDGGIVAGAFLISVCDLFFIPNSKTQDTTQAMQAAQQVILYLFFYYGFARLPCSPGCRCCCRLQQASRVCAFWCWLREKGRIMPPTRRKRKPTNKGQDALGIAMLATFIILFAIMTGCDAYDNAVMPLDRAVIAAVMFLFLELVVAWLCWIVWKKF